MEMERDCAVWEAGGEGRWGGSMLHRVSQQSYVSDVEAVEMLCLLDVAVRKRPGILQIGLLG